MNLERELPKDDPNATAMQSPGMVVKHRFFFVWFGQQTGIRFGEFAMEFSQEKIVFVWISGDLHVFPIERFPYGFRPLLCECTGEIFSTI